MIVLPFGLMKHNYQELVFSKGSSSEHSCAPVCIPIILCRCVVLALLARSGGKQPCQVGSWAPSFTKARIHNESFVHVCCGDFFCTAE
jgi:hypothetical protein